MKNKRLLNLNSPVTFNEKLAYYKIYDHSVKKTILADKYLLKKYVEEKVGSKYIVNTLYTTIDPESIDFGVLPDSFIIKATHGSGWNIIVKNKNNINNKEIISKCSQFLSMNYYYFGREYQYYNMKPRIIIEELLLDSNRMLPNDYKFFSFNGNTKFIQVDISRYNNHQRVLFNDSWDRLPVEYEFPMYKDHIIKPDKFEEMKKIVYSLTNDLAFSRVDFYYINGRIYVGEITFTPEANIGNFKPKIYDKTFGDFFEINC